MLDPLVWPDAVEDIFSGDLAAVLGQSTAGGGVVLSAVTTFGYRDRGAGTVAFTTSLGMGRKLERIAADPRAALLFHTRQHGTSAEPGVVLVQGLATVRVPPDAERADLARRFDEYTGPAPQGRFWDHWLRVYREIRVIVTVEATRMLWWPTGSVTDTPIVLGMPLPRIAGAQKPPRDAETPRVPVKRVHRSAELSHQLLGVLQSDGMPLILPVSRSVPARTGLTLTVPGGGLVPAGGVRAGYLAHSFHPQLIGLRSAAHTGWLMADHVGGLRWTPHTRLAFTSPRNKTLSLLGSGLAARYGYRTAVKQRKQDILRYLQSH
jgi:hypothetical protein